MKPKTWFGIRHIRWLYHAIQVHRFAQMCGRLGLGLGLPNPADEAVLEAIWKGDA
jgi:hypothetical protein